MPLIWVAEEWAKDLAKVSLIEHDDAIQRVSAMDLAKVDRNTAIIMRCGQYSSTSTIVSARIVTDGLASSGEWHSRLRSL